MRFGKTKRLILMAVTLVLLLGVLAAPVYASIGPEDDREDEIILAVSTTWLDTEMLRIDVYNERTGTHTSLAIRLSDYLGSGENSPFINIQAVDLDGNHSGVIQIRNPFYVPYTVSFEEAPVKDGDEIGEEEAAPHPNRPLTPDGSGTVVDNVTDADGVEFFTIFTEDGNEFFLIVDRQRHADNVYLLNTVTEEDLLALARMGGREPNLSGTGIPVPVHPEPTPEPEPVEETPEPPVPELQADYGNLIVIAVVVALVGGVAYYFKIHKKKNDSQAMDAYEDEDEDDFGDDSYDDDGWDDGPDETTGGGDEDGDGKD